MAPRWHHEPFLCCPTPPRRTSCCRSGCPHPCRAAGAEQEVPPTSRSVATSSPEKDHRPCASSEHWHRVALHWGGWAPRTARVEVEVDALNWKNAPHFGGIAERDEPNSQAAHVHTPTSRKLPRCPPQVACSLSRCPRSEPDCGHVCRGQPQNRWRCYDAPGAGAVCWVGWPLQSARIHRSAPRGAQAPAAGAPFACLEDSTSPPVGSTALVDRGREAEEEAVAWVDSHVR
mmetsp:Transcript_13489/g.29713  ORF Transcript_13489/g.29713 Transcript_13489/m.29713 type:complete len:231 (-) Transcript_13489:1193-1885(-)